MPVSAFTSSPMLSPSPRSCHVDIPLTVIFVRMPRQIILWTMRRGRFTSLAETLGVKRTTAYSTGRRVQETGQVERAFAAWARIRRYHTAHYWGKHVQNFEGDEHFAACNVHQEATRKHDCFQRFGGRTHRYETGPQHRNGSDVREARAAYAHWMYEGRLQEHRSYVDETGFNY